MKDKIVSIPIKNINLEEGEQFDLKKVSLRLLTDGAVSSHGLFIDEVALSTISSTIDKKPILCAYEEDENGNKTDFKGHEIEYQITKEGKKYTVKKVYIEQPVGLLDGLTFQVQQIDNINWVTCDGYLYNEYCQDAVRILGEADGEKAVSIEFKILDGYDGEDNLYHVTKIHFLGVTLLGDNHTPAITGANITKFTQEQNALFATQFEKIVERVNKLNEYKGGIMVKKEELIEKFSMLKGNEEFETLISNEELSIEELENKLFALSNSQIAKAVREAVNSYEVDFTNRWNETYKIQKYYVEDIISSENLVVCEDNQNYYAYYGIPFTMQGDKAVVEFDKAERYIRGDWRKYEGETDEIEVNHAFENELNKVVEKLEKETEDKSKIENELNEVKIKFTELQSENEEINKELDRLKEFEEKILKEQRENEVAEVVSRFEELRSVKGFEEIITNANDISIEELEKSLKILAFDNGIVINKKGSKKSFSKESQLIKTTAQYHTEELSEAEMRYGVGIKKYIR